MNGVDDLVALSTGPRLEGWPTPEAIEREITYKNVRPARVAWIVLRGRARPLARRLEPKQKLLDAPAFAGLVGGFGVMTWGIAMRWAVAGRIPASNMYESLLFLAWGVGLFAVIAFACMRNRLVVLNANAMAALTMALMDLLPIDRLHPPDAARALRHAVARDPRADHHGRLLGARARGSSSRTCRSASRSSRRAARTSPTRCTTSSTGTCSSATSCSSPAS